jgi:hypothetical protein
VVAGAIYISTGRNSAFTHHHAPTGLSSDGQVQELLKETHTKDHWIRLLRSLSQASAKEASLGSKAGKCTTSASVIDAKSKAGTGTLLNTPDRVDGSQESSEDDLIIIPSIDSADQAPEDKLATILVQWSPVVNNLNKVGGQVQTLKTLVGEDISELEGKILDVDARLGLVQGGFEDCGTVWDALSQLKMLADLTGKVADVNHGEIDRLSGRVDQFVATIRQELYTKVQKCLDDVQVAFDGVAEALRTLGTEQARLTEMVLQRPGRDSTLGGDLGQLSARLKLVEACLPSVQGRLGGESLILPTVFGRIKEGTVVSAKHHLPSVKSFKEWNTFDGVSGIKGYIASGMEDLKYQF